MSITPDHHPKECVCGGTGRVSPTGGPVTDPFNQYPCGRYWFNPKKLSPLTEGIAEAANQARDNAWRGIAKYPGTKVMFVSLLQEAGELATQLRAGNQQQIHREALDVAAIALRIAVQGDEDAALAFDPLQALYDGDQEIAELKQLLAEAREHLKNRAPLDENDCPMPTCPECGAYHELVRPGKTQPTCLCEAFQREVEQHKETKDLVDSLRAEVKRLRNHLYTKYLDTVDGEKP